MEKNMKRRENLRRCPSSSSSSSHKHEINKIQANTMGCLSGILLLLSKSHKIPRKFLTFGKKSEKKNHGSALLLVSSSNNIQITKECIEKPATIHRKSFSSPMLPADIQQLSTEKFGTPTGLLDISTESAAGTHEQKKKLIEALKKCDQNLKAIKKFIDTVRSADQGLIGSISSPELSLNSSPEQPSPVSVLGELSGSPFMYYYSILAHKPYNYQGRGQPIYQWQQKKPIEQDYINPRILERNNSYTESFLVSSSSPCGSKAMRASVKEVCRDLAWGESREIGRIGLVLQEQIYMDLIQEIITDLGIFPLPSFIAISCM